MEPDATDRRKSGLRAVTLSGRVPGIMALMAGRRGMLAWALVGGAALCIAGAASMPDENWPALPMVALGAVLLTASTMGALIARRRPDHPIGWLLAAMGFFIAAGLFATVYAGRALVHRPGSLPLGLLAAWLQSWLFAPAIICVPLILLFFPSGHLPSRRWRWVAVLTVAVGLTAILAESFRPGPFEALPSVSNPVGLTFASGPIEYVTSHGLPVLIAVFFLAIASLVVRFRRSAGAERQQLKWFLQAVVVAVVFVAMNPLYFIFLAPPKDAPVALVGLFGFFLPLGGLALVPVGIAIGILRYRAFDIDRLVSRSVSYAAVTLFLAGVFAVLVLVPTTVLGAGRRTPSWVIALATLGVAVLFQPVRARVQRRVDHRFDRARYNAAATIEAFAMRLRDEIDLDALTVELRAVVRGTMQPSHVSVWIAGQRTTNVFDIPSGHGRSESGDAESGGPAVTVA